MRPEEAKRDYYRRASKQLGYRSRAAFKLIDINRSFNIFKDSKYIIDVGSSPGGWSQVVLQFIPNAKIICIDIRNMKPLPQVVFINTSIEDESLPDKILSIFNTKADLILSDLSPNISGIWSLDHIKQIDLVYKVLRLAESVLKKNGKMVIKVFEGEMLNTLKNDLNNVFKEVHLFKPKASRKGSSEIYMICLSKQT